MPRTEPFTTKPNPNRRRVADFVGGSSASSERAPLAPIVLLRKKSVARSAVLPLRKKSHSAQLFAYKCAHDASLSLPTFCGYWCVFSMFDSYYASLHKPRGRKLKGRGERAYARMRNRRHSKALQDAEPTSAAKPSLPLGVSRDTDTKLINSDSVPEKLNI